MKMSKKFVSLFAAIACLTAAMTPKESHAIIIARAISGDHSFNFAITGSTAVNLLLCWIMLPLCALDGKALAQDPNVISSNLKNNGYDDTEINQIVADQSKLMAALKEQGKTLAVEPQDSVETVGQAVRGFVPEASDLYIQYLTESSKLQ